MQRNREAFAESPEQLPVFGTIASRFNDDGVTRSISAVAGLAQLGLRLDCSRLPPVTSRHSTDPLPIVPARVRYLAEIAQTVRHYKHQAQTQAEVARQRQQLLEAGRLLAAERDQPCARWRNWLKPALTAWMSRCRRLLEEWPRTRQAYAGDEFVVQVRNREVRTRLTHTTLSGNKIRRWRQF